MEKEIKWFDFQSLSNNQLYDLLKLRSDVFVVEQVCAYPELDDYDQKAHHGLIYDDEKLVAYIRIYQKNERTWTFGRVVTDPSFRKQGIGQILIKEALKKISTLAKAHSGIIIGAQAHLERYYQQFGFETISKPYDDFGILHIDMKCEIQN